MIDHWRERTAVMSKCHLSSGPMLTVVHRCRLDSDSEPLPTTHQSFNVAKYATRLLRSWQGTSLALRSEKTARLQLSSNKSSHIYPTQTISYRVGIYVRKSAPLPAAGSRHIHPSVCPVITASQAPSLAAFRYSLPQMRQLTSAATLQFRSRRPLFHLG